MTSRRPAGRRSRADRVPPDAMPEPTAEARREPPDASPPVATGLAPAPRRLVIAAVWTDEVAAPEDVVAALASLTGEGSTAGVSVFGEDQLDRVELRRTLTRLGLGAVVPA